MKKIYCFGNGGNSTEGGSYSGLGVNSVIIDWISIRHCLSLSLSLLGRQVKGREQCRNRLLVLSLTGCRGWMSEIERRLMIVIVSCTRFITSSFWRVRYLITHFTYTKDTTQYTNSHDRSVDLDF